MASNNDENVIGDDEESQSPTDTGEDIQRTAGNPAGRPADTPVDESGDNQPSHGKDERRERTEKAEAPTETNTEKKSKNDVPTGSDVAVNEGTNEPETTVGVEPEPEPGELAEMSDDEEEAAVNVIVKDRPPATEVVRQVTSVTTNHAADSGGSSAPTQEPAVASMNIGATGGSNVNASQPVVIKVGTKTGVDISDPGNINGVATVDYNLAALNDEDKPWKKPGADITDYFNYGFTEDSWLAYSEQQRILRAQFTGVNIPVAAAHVSNANVKVVTQLLSGLSGAGPGSAIFRTGAPLMSRSGHDRGDKYFGGGGGGAIGVIGSGAREIRRLGGVRDHGNLNGPASAGGMSIPTAGGAGAYAPSTPSAAAVPPLGSFHPSVPAGGGGGGGGSGSGTFSVPPPSFHVPPPGLAPPTFLHPAALAAAVNYAPPHDLFSVPPPGGPMPPQVPWDAASVASGVSGHGHHRGQMLDGRERTPDSIRSEEEAKLAETQAEMLEREMRGDHRRGDRGGYRGHRDRDRDRDRERDRDRDRDRDRERERTGRSPRPIEREYGRERVSARDIREHGREREHHRSSRYRSRSRSRSRDRKYGATRISKRSRYALPAEEEPRYPGPSSTSGASGTSRRHSKRSRRSRSRSHSPGSTTGSRSGHRARGGGGGDSPPAGASRRRGGALGGDAGAGLGGDADSTDGAAGGLE